MSALSDVSQDVSIPPELKALAVSILAPLFWKWYHDHINDTLFKVSWWIFHKTVHVSDLYSVFELLFGPEPLTSLAT